MDYLKTYTKTYNSNYKTLRNELLSTLNEIKENKQNFQSKFDTVISNLKQKIEVLHDELEANALTGCLKTFRRRNYSYDNTLTDDERINLVLNNEVKTVYDETCKLSFTETIELLAEVKFLDDTIYHFETNFEYYKWVFAEADFKLFYPKNFNTNLFFKNKKYKTNQTAQITNPTKASSADAVLLDVTEPTKSYITETFDDKERAVLLQVLNTNLDSRQIPLTELLKLTLIIGSTSYFDIFNTPSASNAYLYKLAQKGVNVYNRKESKSKIYALIRKLEYVGVKVVSEELKVCYNRA